MGYIFKKIFPLTGINTNFIQKITYTTYFDTNPQNLEPIIAKGEKPDTLEYIMAEEEKTVEEFEFSVRISKHAQHKKNLLFECWDRKLQFFHNDTPIDVADETMKELTF